MKPVQHIKIGRGMKISELVKQMENSGVMGAGRIAKATEIMGRMFNDKDCKIFFGVAGAMVPGGMKELIIDVLKTERVAAFVTTGANLVHDLIEALGNRHYQGSADVDDKKLHKMGIDRIYNAFMKNEVYAGLEKFFKSHYEEIRHFTKINDFLWKLGSLVPAAAKDSILKVCYENKIPIFCPGIADSGIGLMMWGNIAAGKHCDLQAFADMDDIISLAWKSKKNGILYVGGGLPKNYIQQALQFSKGASYGVQLTADLPQWGGSSGAELREGISWGKMNEKGKFIDVYGDATITLPLVWAAVKDKISSSALLSPKPSLGSLMKSDRRKG